MADRNSRSRSTPPPSPIAKLLPIIIIVAVIALGGALYLFMPHSGNAPAPTAAPPTGTPGAPAQPTAAAAPAAVPEMSKEQLLKEGSTAMREERIVSPAGNNALEFYLKVLEKDANNQTAKDALREMFPFATPVVEQNINTGNVDEASREIDMLAKADPNNYTLTILRGKLDAKRKQVDSEQRQAAAAAAAAAARTSAAQTAPAAAPAAATPAPADATAAATPAGAPAAATTRPAAAPAATAAATPPPAAPAAAPPPAGGESRSAELVKSANPEYPREAFIKHTEGWVEVEFTVTPDGTVTNASVAGANPPRVFNDAALRAVQRWTFKPKMDNGKAVEERMKRRIEFKLGAG